MKGKYVYVFGDGSVMTDRNGYKTMRAAKAWAKGHNKGAKVKRRKVTNVIARR